MDFDVIMLRTAQSQYDDLQNMARRIRARRLEKDDKKSSRQEGLFAQVAKALQLLAANPRHRGLQTHATDEFAHPYIAGDKVWEAYIQNHTPGAYRLFWCYGPNRGEITIIAITPHP